MNAEKNKKSFASRMRHYVYIQTVVKTPDSHDDEGGETRTWETPANPVPAEVTPIQAKQIYQNRSVGVDATHLIKIRGLCTVDDSGDYRILFDSRPMEIITVENIDELNFVKVLTCKEIR
jgi:head-tail adaptor